MFSIEEIIYIVTLSACIIGIFVNAMLQEENYYIWNPLTFVSIFFIYYTLLGPILSVVNENTFFRNVEHRDFLVLGWRCALVSFLSISAGYYIITERRFVKLKFSPSEDRLKKIGIQSFVICIIILFIYTGTNLISRINFLDAQTEYSGGYSGAFQSYLMQALVFFITSSALLLLYGLKSKKFLWFAIVFVISGSLFINEAFRYRLVVLVLSSICIYYLYIDKKPNVILLSIVAVLFVFLMGIIEYTRSYGQGLDVTRIETMDNQEILSGGLNESSVFSATSFLIYQVDEKVIPRTGFDMFTNTIAAPVPRKIWPGKPAGEYFLDTMKEIYGIYGVGEAMLFFGEYYLSFGWLGVIVFSFLLGMFFKWVWLWFIPNRRNPFAIAAIAIFNSYIYVIVSRGYLSQAVTLFFFTVGPIFLIIYLYKRQKI